MITFLVLFATLSLGICTASQPLRIPDEFHYEHYNTEDGDYDSEDATTPVPRSLPLSTVRRTTIPFRTTFQVLQSTSSPGLNYTCPVTYTESTGVIEGPRYIYMSYYRHSLPCNYNIIVGGNKSVLLDFLSFYVDTWSNIHCRETYVMIDCLMNGKNVTTPYTNRRFCGEIKWSSAMKLSGCTTVVWKFISTTGDGYARFRILYNVSATDAPVSDDNLPNDISCGETLYTQSGAIILPRNPTGYLVRINCTYTISANQSSRIAFNMSSLHEKLRSSFLTSDCDSFTIRCANKSTLAHLCSSSPSLWNPYLPSRHCQILKLTIRSDTYDVQETLKIPFTVVAEADICGNTSFSGDSGSIVSLDYPRSFRDILNCTYTIDIGTNRSILLEVEELDLGQHRLTHDGRCYSAWLTFRCLSNRTNSNPYLNTPQCEKMVPALVLHGCHAITLQFVTDDLVVVPGFKYVYTVCESTKCAINTSKLSGCGNTSFTDSSGFITSPSYPVPYSPGLNCIYTIAVGQNKTVTFDFLYFDLRDSYHYAYKIKGLLEECQYDWLMIHCMSGETELPSAYTNKQLCGAHIWQFDLHGCESVMMHFFRSNRSHSHGQGFKIYYETSVRYSDCGNTSFTGSSGIVTSPNFPGRYPHNLNCFYSIAMEQNVVVSLEFLAFDLDNGTYSTARPEVDDSDRSSCENDWLMINCVPERRVNQYENTRLCGLKEAPFTWAISGCIFLNLIFVTDSTISKSGFRIQYTITSVTIPSQPSEISTSSRPQITQSIECEGKCQNNSEITPCECSTQLSSSPNSAAKGAEELKSARVSPLLLLLVVPVLLALGFGLVYLVRRRRSSSSRHERFLENEHGNLENRDAVFQPTRSDASVTDVPLKSMKSDDKEVRFPSENANPQVNSI